ncbi:hypothetical protein HN51_028924 [Arachis hypogaea]|uniref:Uncharacterized protein n=1 Tax=Arachis hypogaea TaxID=3818 RepID=A0A445BGK1_ARAHY|nr:uric acid degradation bifunctional protein TTL isoform X1 [Arachis hypogaea]RYR37797.1 hypothetical protein Ahy_A09g042688 isoform A [Arachis hypogaea]RYR37798.1 hypothetical protein Ahy_A09g042688 isoform B [Arachis hypogaea]
MEQAALFSSLEHATLFTRDLWFNKLPINSCLDAFAVHMHIGEVVNKASGSILKELAQFKPKYHKKFGFGFITSTDKRLLYQIPEEVKAHYENTLIVELDIVSGEIHSYRKKTCPTLGTSISGQDLRDNRKNRRDSLSFNAGRRRWARR